MSAPSRPTMRVTDATVVVGLLLLAALGARWRGELVTRPAPPAAPAPSATVPPVTLTAEPTVSASDFPLPEGAEAYEVPGWVTPVLLTILGTIVAIVLVLLARRLWPQRLVRFDGDIPVIAATATVSDPDPDLTDSLAAARWALHHTGPPRDAVIAAWVALEEDAVRLGAPREPSQTPTEFTLALLRRTGADPDAVTALRQTYLAARFSTAPVTPEQVEVAGDALARIEATWR